MVRAVRANPTDPAVLLPAVDFLMDGGKTRPQAWAIVRGYAERGAARLMCRAWDDFEAAQPNPAAFSWEWVQRAAQEHLWKMRRSAAPWSFDCARVICEYRLSGQEIWLTTTNVVCVCVCWLIARYCPERFVRVPDLGAESPHPKGE
jgi:FAD/FMN-containing dehydrogenase